MLRWIEQIAGLIARLLRGGSGADLDLARDHVDDAIAQLLGPLAVLVPRLETASVVELLHDPDRLYGYARLLALRGAVAEARGEPDAREDRDRALELARAAVALSREPPPEWRSWIDRAASAP